MKQHPLLKLYPRVWRERYGDELQALLAEGPLSVRDLLDLLRGATDAQFSARRLILRRTFCGNLALSHRFGPKDGIYGATAMLLGSVVMTLIASLLGRYGSLEAARETEQLAFPVALLLMSHAMFLRRQSLAAKLVITGGTFLILLVIR